MSTFPYFLLLQGTALANANITLSYAVSNTQRLTLNQIRQISAGTFNINSIRDSTTQFYTNASQATPIKNTFIQTGGSANLGFGDFPTPMVIEGSTILFFDLQDTSAASNLISILLLGVLETGVK